MIIIFHMTEKIKEAYNTKQRGCIMRFLKNANDRHFTAEELFYALNQAAENNTVKTPGLATIYRTLDKLEKEGVIRKYNAGSGDKACYQYINKASGCCEHYHLKCTSCGKLIHLDCSHIQTLASHISENHRFTLDTSRTVLYGLCAACGENNGEKSL